ncbi:MAG: serine hydrolase [Symploca sp. SIO2E6]|nr:serine hydrolase [Symploca sp. SIO2E6]
MTKNTPLQFTAIVAVVSLIFIVFALTLVRQKSKTSAESSTQPSLKTVEQPNPFFPEQNGSYPNLGIPSVQLSPNKVTSLPLPEPRLKQQQQNLVYNVNSSPNFQYSKELKQIINQAVQLVKQEKLPVQPLSITLIDVNLHEIAGYQEHQPRYPASIVKLFWMVILYGQLQTGYFQYGETFFNDLHKMIVESDNEASSRIIDIITDTKSGSNLNNIELKEWIKKRKYANLFFKYSGYKNINITQKTFPIRYLDMDEPEGRDLQMRGDPKAPVRNAITTQQSARLMYEIMTDQAVSRQASQAMKGLLIRELKPEAWIHLNPNDGEFNPVRAFLGESLPTDIHFLSKAGWTSGSRQEVACIITEDKKTAYILAIIADDRAYSQNGKMFPKISRLVFERMVARRQ